MGRREKSLEELETYPSTQSITRIDPDFGYPSYNIQFQKLFLGRNVGLNLEEDINPPKELWQEYYYIGRNMI